MQKKLIWFIVVWAFVVYIMSFNYGGCGGAGGGGGSTTNSGSSGQQYRAPIITLIGNQTVLEGATLTFTVSATDPDGDALTYAAYNVPAGAAFTAATKTFTWMPTDTQSGTYSGVRFRITDATGLYTEETISIIVTDVPAPSAPSAPSALMTGVISATQIDLAWTDNSTDETGFKIERKVGISGIYGQIDIVSASITSYSNTGLTDGTNYYYRVCAYSDAGNSAYSNESNATTPVIIVPPAQVATPIPANSATGVPINTSLSWAAASGAIDYDVYFGPNPPVYKINTGSYSYNPVTLVFNTTYYWRVDSKNSGGTVTGTVWSFTTTAAPSPPAQVTSPNPADGAANISITQQLGWISATGATSYDVYFGASSPPAYQGNFLNTSYNPGALSFSTTYYWRINSNNIAGATTGNIWSFSTKAPTPPPQVTSPAPADNATNVSITAQLSWAAMTDTVSYDVYFGTTSPGTLLTNTVLTSFSPSVLSWSTPYYWLIDSINTVGTTTGTVWTFTTKASTPPPQVTSPNPADSATNVPITTTQVSWASATDATSYDVYFGTTSPGTLLTNTANTNYALSSLFYATTYYWRIDPKNTSGTTTGQVWNFITQSPPPPNAPSGLTATPVSAGQINLAWTDNANNETSFKIERKTGAGGIYSQIVVLSADATSYSNTGLSASTTYYYRIRAANAAGDSAYSNEASAVTTVSVSVNTWTQKIAQGTAGSPAARSAHLMVWDGTNSILFGGTDGSYKNDIYWYNPISNTWTEKIAQGAVGSPSARNYHSMAWDGTRVIMFGGSAGSYKNDLWWYNPISNTWTEKIAHGTAGSPTARDSHSMVWDGTRCIMFGGYDSSYSYKNDLWWYDPGTNTWTQKIAQGTAGSPAARYAYSMAWDGTRVIMFGGRDSSGSYKNDVWWYDPGTNTWTQKIAHGTTGSPAARYILSVAWDGTRVIMFGGFDGSSYKNDLWWYDPGTNTWTQKIAHGTAGLPTARAMHSMVWGGQRGIMFGGNDGSLKNDLWWYEP